MTIGDTELGRLTKDHLQTHNQVARHRAELEQFGENLILLGNNLKAHPQDISVAEAKVMLKDDHAQDRTILWTGTGHPHHPPCTGGTPPGHTARTGPRSPDKGSWNGTHRRRHFEPTSSNPRDAEASIIVTTGTQTVIETPSIPGETRAKDTP